MKEKPSQLEGVAKLLTDSGIPQELAAKLVAQYTQIRDDVLTQTLGHASPGIFVETFIQILQCLERGNHDQNPDVEIYLRGLESRAAPLPDSLRILASRILRGLYALRSKRGIAHTGETDPNLMDLRMIHASSSWLLAELLRTRQGIKPDEAERTIEDITLPPVPAVESFGNYIVVLDRTKSPGDELLIVLRHYYPHPVSREQLYVDMKRRSRNQINGALGRLYREALLEGDNGAGYKLTRKGLTGALRVLKAID